MVGEVKQRRIGFPVIDADGDSPKETLGVVFDAT